MTRTTGPSDLLEEIRSMFRRLLSHRVRAPSQTVHDRRDQPALQVVGDFLPSPAQAVAIVDRLIDQATILRFGG
jgi:hypothetical protein